MKEITDPAAPDRKRLIANPAQWTKVRRELCAEARDRCEDCRKPTPFEHGDADHVRGRGGGRRDDRIWIPYPDGLEDLNYLGPQPEGTQALVAHFRYGLELFCVIRGIWHRRNLRWLCGGPWGCHTKKHNPKACPSKSGA